MFNQKEIKILKQFFDIMKLEDGKTVTETFKDIYSLNYVKNFIPNENQIRLSKEEFDIFAAKILRIVNED